MHTLSNQVNTASEVRTVVPITQMMELRLHHKMQLGQVHTVHSLQIPKPFFHWSSHLQMRREEGSFVDDGPARCCRT